MLNRRNDSKKVAYLDTFRVLRNSRTNIIRWPKSHKNSSYKKENVINNEKERYINIKEIEIKQEKSNLVRTTKKLVLSFENGKLFDDNKNFWGIISKDIIFKAIPIEVDEILKMNYKYYDKKFSDGCMLIRIDDNVYLLRIIGIISGDKKILNVDAKEIGIVKYKK